MTVDTRTRPISAYAETRAAGDSEFTRRFVATTSGVKRDGLDLVMEGGSTENFMRNPVFLWVHDYFGEKMPIGLVKNVRILKSKMIVTVLFDDGDEFAMEVLRKYDAGFLSAVSIGWDTLEFDRETMQVLEWDLLDVSAVPVPGDPDALMMRTKSMLRSLGQELIDKFPEDEDDIKIHVGGVIEDPDELAQMVREAIEQLSVGIPGAVCPDCKADISREYVTVDEDGISVAYCVDCADKISGEQEETIDTQEGEHMAMERMERVVAALDELRSAWSDLIDSAGNEDDDESMATLLAAFTGDETNEGEED